MPKKSYADKPVANWNSNDFLRYAADRHLELYGVEYRPFRNWQAERGLIGGIIGTRGKNGKPRKHEPEVLKRFIDECFKSHRTTAEYPGVSFGWFYTYKANVWQRVVAEARRESAKAAEESVGLSAEELDGWL